MLEFLLNGVPQKVNHCDPNSTLLDHLRTQLNQNGTKEGCASGDCGACTVAVGEISNEVDSETGDQADNSNEDNIHYKSVNACITLLANLHGKHVITVEGLANGEQLHPSQQAMIDCHGSQCGFCTPGFVMSMFVLERNHDSPPNRHEISEALGGNLCRCTGYRPIIDATVQMFDPQLSPSKDRFSEQQSQWLTQLRTMNKEDHVRLVHNDKKYFAPTHLEDLAELMLRHPNARLVAGGTDLALEFTQFLREIDTLIYTGRVADLKRVETTDNELSIGAAATYSEFSPALLAFYPDARELIERIGSRQIRNQGTLGGNIGNASPIGDMPPLLIAMNAQLVLRCGDATRTIAVEDYFVGYKKTLLHASEFIEKIIIPKPAKNSVFRAYKISKRYEDDISASCGAFSLTLKDNRVSGVRIAFGGMAEIPKRALHCEQALLQQPLSSDNIANAARAMSNDYQPISDFRASSEYRLKVSQNMLTRLHLELTHPENEHATRVINHA
ncbi:MAG: xanthine dehydrogenase small subunit [Cellvibrionaceae bacterium]|nr:xanthine dehydrogenase small subunit [Cellvibrionaceae bacterium]|tara:strand:- start:13887 stop:15389 length:1503 start_codon:yes stop_codon:yes gene_type:complete